MTLPAGWIGGWLPSMARSGSVSGASTSYSTTIAVQRPPTRLRVVCSDRRDRLADVADDVAGEDRLIAADQSVGRLAGHIVGGDDRRDPVDAPRRCDVDSHDPRGGMWRTQCRAPQEAVGR